MTIRTISSIRLPAAQRWATYTIFTVVGLSGLAWSLLHDVLQWGWMLSERRLLIAHGVAAAIALVVIGALLPLHIRLAFHVKRNLKSGIAALSLIVFLGLTGLLLYYSGEDWRDVVRWSHFVVGTIACLAIPAHVWLGRRQKTLLLALAENGQVEKNSNENQPIPKASCLNYAPPLTSPLNLSLSQKGVNYLVSCVVVPPENLQWAVQLQDIGFLPGELVSIMTRGLPGGDPLVVRIGLSTFALRTVEAACVQVVPLVATSALNQA